MVNHMNLQSCPICCRLDENEQSINWKLVAFLFMIQLRHLNRLSCDAALKRVKNYPGNNNETL